MACIDIYQALTEDRPYKKGLSHEKTCEMLDDMAQKGFVDFDIIGGLLIARHHANIKRLLSGTENKLGAKKGEVK